MGVINHQNNVTTQSCITIMIIFLFYI